MDNILRVFPLNFRGSFKYTSYRECNGFRVVIAYPEMGCVFL